jgi:hypothetical protein
MLARRLRHDYPDYYHRVIDECKKAGIELFLSFYNDDLNDKAETSVNWAAFYEDEKRQFALIDDLYKNNKLLREKFKANSLLSINNTDAENIIYSIPLAYRMEFKRLEPDQLDEVLINLMMSRERSYIELLDLITEYFDEGETEQGRQDISKLLSMKLRAGLYAHIYKICE